MLRTKSSFANIEPSNEGTGQNTLFYNPSTGIVKYFSSLPPRTYDAANATIESFTTTTFTSLSFANTLLTTPTIGIGTYFVICCFNFTFTGGGILQVQLRNNQTSSTFGDYDTISIQVTGTLAPGSTTGLTTMTAPGTITLQARRTTGTNVSIRGGSISVLKTS